MVTAGIRLRSVNVKVDSKVTSGNWRHDVILKILLLLCVFHLFYFIFI